MSCGACQSRELCEGKDLTAAQIHEPNEYHDAKLIAQSEDHDL
jgi:hypothetical protein